MMSGRCVPLNLSYSPKFIFSADKKTLFLGDTIMLTTVSLGTVHSLPASDPQGGPLAYKTEMASSAVWYVDSCALVLDGPRRRSTSSRVECKGMRPRHPLACESPTIAS